MLTFKIIQCKTHFEWRLLRFAFPKSRKVHGILDFGHWSLVIRYLLLATCKFVIHQATPLPILPISPRRNKLRHYILPLTSSTSSSPASSSPPSPPFTLSSLSTPSTGFYRDFILTQIPDTYAVANLLAAFTLSWLPYCPLAESLVTRTLDRLPCSLVV